MNTPINHARRDILRAFRSAAQFNGEALYTYRGKTLEYALESCGPGAVILWRFWTAADLASTL